MRSASLIVILACLEMQLAARMMSRRLLPAIIITRELPKSDDDDFRNLTLGVIDNVCKPIRGGKRRHPRILKKIMNSNQKKARTPRRKVSQHLIGLCIQTELQFHIE
jgi:hypothetical protein